MPDLTPPPMSEEDINLIAADGMRNAAGGIYAGSVTEFARAIEAHVNEQWRQRLEAIDYSRDWDVLYRIKEQG